MISILDEIQLPADALTDVLQLVNADYLDAALERGLSPAGQWVSPPVVIADQPNTLWLQWQVSDVMSYYGSRAMQTEAVTAFWEKVDAIAIARRRHVRVAANTDLPASLASERENK